MAFTLSRRQFVRNAATVSLLPFVPRFLGPEASSAQRILVRSDAEIGLVRRKFHGHFAETISALVIYGRTLGGQELAYRRHQRL